MAVVPHSVTGATGELGRTTNAITSWWSSPSTVNDGSRTFVASSARQGSVRLSRLDDDGSTRTVTLDRFPVPDDHNTPAVAFSAERPEVVVFYTRHGSDTTMRYRSVDRDTLTVGALQTLTFPYALTYAQVLVLGERIVLITRAGAGGRWSYTVSEDFGGTWSDQRQLIDPTGHGRVYMATRQSEEDPTQVLLAVYSHPHQGAYRSIDVGRIDLGSGAILASSGEQVADLYGEAPMLSPGVLGAAITPPSTHRLRLLDVGWLHGAPSVAWAEWNHALDPGGPARYRLAVQQATVEGEVWAPLSWSARTGDVIGYTPRVQYVGGMSIGRDGAVFVARNGLDRRGTRWWRLEQVDVAEDLTARPRLARLMYRSTTPIMRPTVPLGRGITAVTAVETLHYSHYATFRANILGFR